MAKASQLRRGSAILINNEIHLVTETLYRAPGKMRAFVQLTCKNINNGRVYSNRHKPSDDFESVDLFSKKVQYLYNESDLYYFMKLDDYETIHMSEEDMGIDKNYLKDELELSILFYKEKPIQIELPKTISFKVVSTIPGLKGDTVTNATKPATLETGLEVSVPLFIKEGNVINVNTETGAYQGKA